MKKTDVLNELRGLSPEDLKERLRSLNEELMKLRFSKVAGQLDQTHRVREVRRDIARVATVISEQQNGTLAA